MHINIEAAEQHAVQSYSGNKIQINSVIYEHSLIVSREKIISDLSIKHVVDIDEPYLQLLLQEKPELILIGHVDTGLFPPMSIISTLSRMRIGVESMSLGAACRTYNVLLAEGRAVVAGFIF